MDSGSGRSRHRRSGGSSRRRHSGKSSSKQSSKAGGGGFQSSLFTNVTASRATVVLKPKEKPVFISHLVALAGMLILILLGGSHHLFALSWSLLLPGVWLLVRPPEYSLNRSLDLAVVLFLAVQLFAFLPQFYWPDATWRQTAVEAFGIELPSVLSLQPGRSLNAWVACLGGVAWFYVLSSFPINPVGRKWIHLWVSASLGILGAIVLWGNLSGARYSGAEEATAFTFFPNRNQTSNLMAVGGVLAFAYGLDGFRRKRLVNVVGLVATALCLGALVVGVSRAGILLYFTGIFIWFVFRRRRSAISLYLKIGLPLLLIFFSFFISSNQQVVSRVTDFLAAPSEWNDAFRASIYKDSFAMLRDAPLTGVGVGNFEAVFPQYRDLSRNYQRVAHPESDYLWIASEGGLLAVLALVFIFVAYFRSCRGLSEGKGGAFRIAALVALIVFVLHSLVDVSAHRPGTAYFALFMAALALPMRGVDRPQLSKWIPRLVGGLLCAFGLMLLVAGIMGKPSRGEAELAYLTSAVEQRLAEKDFEGAEALVAKRLSARPMDWQAYFQRAQIELSRSGNISRAAADFRRARFVEPILASVSYEEGFVWLPYDYGRAISAWRKTLFREAENMDSLYRKIIRARGGDADFLSRISQLSEINTHYRTQFLISLRDDYLKLEIERELAIDPRLSRFSEQQRSLILERWIDRGDHESAGVYLDRYGHELEDVWWLRAQLYKEQAQFEEAVATIQGAIEVPQIPDLNLDASDITRLERAYSLSKQDIVKATALLRYYLDTEERLKALAVCETMSEYKDPPAYALYWKAQIFYELGDYIESYYSFEKFIQLSR